MATLATPVRVSGTKRSHEETDPIQVALQTILKAMKEGIPIEVLSNRVDLPSLFTNKSYEEVEGEFLQAMRGCNPRKEEMLSILRHFHASFLVDNSIRQQLQELHRTLPGLKEHLSHLSMCLPAGELPGNLPTTSQRNECEWDDPLLWAHRCLPSEQIVASHSFVITQIRELSPLLNKAAQLTHSLLRLYGQCAEREETLPPPSQDPLVQQFFIPFAEPIREICSELFCTLLHQSLLSPIGTDPELDACRPFVPFRSDPRQLPPPTVSALWRRYFSSLPENKRCSFDDWILLILKGIPREAFNQLSLELHTCREKNQRSSDMAEIHTNKLFMRMACREAFGLAPAGKVRTLQELAAYFNTG